MLICLVGNCYTVLLQHMNNPYANNMVSANRVAQNPNEALISQVPGPLFII